MRGSYIKIREHNINKMLSQFVNTVQIILLLQPCNECRPVLKLKQASFKNTAGGPAMHTLKQLQVCQARKESLKVSDVGGRCLLPTVFLLQQLAQGGQNTYTSSSTINGLVSPFRPQVDESILHHPIQMLTMQIQWNVGSLLTKHENSN